MAGGFGRRATPFAYRRASGDGFDAPEVRIVQNIAIVVDAQVGGKTATGALITVNIDFDPPIELMKRLKLKTRKAQPGGADRRLLSDVHSFEQVETGRFNVLCRVFIPLVMSVAFWAIPFTDGKRECA